MDAFERAIHHRLQLTCIFHFPALGENLARFLNGKPGRITIVFVRLLDSAHFHQEGFDHKLLHTAGLPKDALGMQVQMEVTRLDETDCTGLFQGLSLRGLTVGESRVGCSLGECPLVAAVGLNEEEFYTGAALAVANGRYL